VDINRAFPILLLI